MITPFHSRNAHMPEQQHTRTAQHSGVRERVKSIAQCYHWLQRLPARRSFARVTAGYSSSRSDFVGSSRSCTATAKQSTVEGCNQRAGREGGVSEGVALCVCSFAGLQALCVCVLLPACLLHT